MGRWNAIFSPVQSLEPLVSIQCEQIRKQIGLTFKTNNCVLPGKQL